MFKNFFKFLLPVFLLVIFSGMQNSFAQLTGAKAIPGDYATIQAAIADLNTQGVGTGGVTFNVAAGHTETFTTDSAGFITATGTATDQIIFQKSGVGANPLITASALGNISTSTSLTANGDGIIVIEGGDYITFDGIDLQENVAATGDQFMESGYFLKKLSGDDACKNVTIMNCNISLDKATRYSYGIYVSNLVGGSDATVTSTGGRSENIKIYNCTISDVYVGIQVRGDAATTPYDFYDQNIEIGVDGANSITDFGGGASTGYGIYAIYQNNLKVANTTINGGAGNTTTLYGMFLSTGTNSNVDIYNNTVTVEGGATTSGTYGISTSMGSSGTDNTINIYNNIVENCSYPTATSGALYCMYNSGSGFTVNIYGNTIRNNTKGGTSGTMYLLYSGNAGANGFANVYSNDIYGNVNNAGTGDLYCLYSNEVSTVTKMVYDNNIYNNTGQDDVYGLYTTLGTLAHVYGNNIYDITTATTLTTSPYVSGIYISSGTDVYVYNNFISDLKAPDCAATDAIRGINIATSTSSATRNLYYNTIFLNASSTGTNFGSTGIYSIYSSTATTSALDMRNNNIVNTSTPNGTGLTVAFRRSSATSLANYNTISNNNNFYAGTPSVSNLLFSDGTNEFQTLAEVKAHLAPGESNSVAGNPPFVDVGTAPYDLHISTTTPTQLESGGTPITTPIAVNDDYDGDIRNATTPDIGADEFTGIGADLTPPTIVTTPLANTSSLTDRTLTVTITDASGVPTSGIGLPVLYWRINNGSYTAATGAYLSGDDYQFTFGAGVAYTDHVYYYIVAQDNADNVIADPFTGSGGFTANPPAASTPPTEPYSYYVFDATPIAAGTYTVGLSEFIQATGKQVYFETRTRTVTRKNVYPDPYAQTEDQTESKTEIINPVIPPEYITVTESYKQLMENGEPFDMRYFSSPEAVGVYPTLSAAIEDLSNRGVSGPVEFSLIDTFYPNETYPIVIGEVAGASSTNTITIKPASGVQAEIPGDVTQTQPTIYCIDSDWLIFDGSNTPGGTTKDLKIVGLPNEVVACAVYLEGSASNNVFKNLVMESQETSTGFGTFVFSDPSIGMDNNLVQNCTIKNIDSISYKPRVGVYTYTANVGDGNQIIDCDIYDWYTYGIRLGGGPSTNTLVSGCEIYMTSPGTTSPYGIYVLRVDGLIVEKCKISEIMGSSTPRGIYVAGNTTSGSSIIKNNFISLSSSTNLTSGTIYGLDYFGYASNSFEAYHNSIYIGGTDVTTGSTYALTCRDDATTYKAYNNSVYNARSNSAGTGTHYAIYISDTNQVTREFDYNDFFADGSGGTFGYYQGPGAIADLATWQTTTGLDARSLSADPGYIGGDDLHIKPFFTTLDGQGTYIASVPDDIDGDTRNVTTPDIGADEYTYVPPTVIDPTDVTATPIAFDQIDIGFTPNGNNDNVVIVFDLDGTFSTPPGPPPAIGQPFAGGTLIANTTTSPYMHTSLTGNTAYYYKLWSYDGIEYSFGVEVNATTLFPPISTFPYIQDFENAGSIPDGWEQDAGNAENWLFGTTAGYAANVDHTTGTGYMAWIDDSSPYTANPSILISPPMDILALATPAASFWYWIGRDNGGTSNLHIDVYNGTTWTDDVVPALTEQNGWALVDFDLTPYKSGNTQVRFRAYENLSDFDSDISLDDFSVFNNTTAPNCAVNVSPADTDSNVVIDTDLSWANGGGVPTGYLLYFGTDGGGVTPPTNLVNGADLGNVTTYDHPIDISYATTYYWQVVAYNGNGQATGCSIWSFTTMDDPTIATFPWNDALENPGTPGTPEGWMQDTADDFDWTFDAGGTTSTGTGPSVDHNPGTSVGTYGYTEATGPAAGDIANILTPPLNLSGLTNPILSFWYHMYGAAMGTLNVDYSTDGGSTWTNGWTLSGDQGDEWFNGEIYLPTSADFVRFSGVIGSSFTSDMAFDDVSIYDLTTPPNCAVNVSPPDGEDSVTIFTSLDWANGGGGTTGYKLFFGTDNPPTNIVNGTDLGNVTTYQPAATLSNATTYYWQVIAYNPVGDATGCAVWSFTTHPDAPLAGDYTVGLAEFNRITGKNIYFDKVVKKVMKEVSVEVLADKERIDTDATSFMPKTESKVIEVEEISWIPMENDQPYTGELYVHKTSSPQYNYPEGTDGIYSTITAAVADLNVRGAGAAVNFILTDATYTVGETYPIVMDFGNPTNSVVTIKPNTGVTTLVQGASPSGQIFKILSSNVTIDGSNAGGTDRSLTLENTSTTSPQVVAIGSVGNVPITDVTLMNCVVINGAQTSSAVVISDGTAPGNDGYFNDITVQNNSIQKAYMGAYCRAAAMTGNGSGLLLTGNDLSTSGTNSIRYIGLYVQGVDGGTVSNNTIANFDGVSSEDDRGIWLATGNTNITVENNYIYSLKYTGTSGYGAQGIVVSSITLNANNLIKNNMIYDISGDGWGTSIPGDNPYGIYIFGSIAQSGIKIYHNSINLFGNTLSQTNAISAGIAIGTNSIADIQDNIIVNNLGVDDVGVGSIGIWLQSDNTQLEASNYNDIFVNATGIGVNYVGQIATTGYADLAGWQTGSGADANSISVDPGFISNTDLHIDPSSTAVSGMGIYLASVTTDIDGDTRLDPPDIGADEYEGAATFQLTVNVLDGWNMVSVPGVNPDGQGVAQWWPGRTGDVFGYNSGYVIVTNTTPGDGYWMKNVGAQTYNTGDEWPAGGIELVAHDPIPGNAGWNLIGGYENTATVANITTNPSGLQEGPVYGFNGGYTTPATMDPGYGYWIKLSGAGDIILPNALAKGTEPVEWFKEDWGRIVVTDATGKKFTLYAVNGEVNLDQYEMPPLPPQGMFDIRYNSGRIAEDINSSVKGIDMTGVTYPITVKVENMDMRLMDETGKKLNENVKDGEEIVINDAQISKLMVSGELLPTVYALEQNYPNPFNPSTTIEFSLPEDVSSVKLSIYSILGEKVAELVNTSLIAGNYKYQWNGTNVASGMYIYELRTDKFVSIKKMMLLK